MPREKASGYLFHAVLGNTFQPDSEVTIFGIGVQSSSVSIITTEFCLYECLVELALCPSRQNVCYNGESHVVIPVRVWKFKLSCGKLPDGKFAFKLFPMRLYTQFACFSGPNQTGSLISFNLYCQFFGS